MVRTRSLTRGTLASISSLWQGEQYSQIATPGDDSVDGSKSEGELEQQASLQPSRRRIALKLALLSLSAACLCPIAYIAYRHLPVSLNATRIESTLWQILENINYEPLSTVDIDQTSDRSPLESGLPALLFPGKDRFNNHVYIALKAGYLGLKTRRSVIFPNPDGPLPLSAIFDHQGASKKASSPVSFDLSHITNDTLRLGCWAEHAGANFTEFGTQIATWPIPSIEGYDANSYELVEQISARFETFETTLDHLAETDERFKLQRRPSDKLLCMYPAFGLHEQDFSSIHGRPYDNDIMALQDPAWQYYGRHLYFSREIERLADLVIASTIDNPAIPFATVHIRRGDFCSARFSRANCNQAHAKTLDHYAAALDGFARQDDCNQKHGFPKVLVMTDELDPTFAEAVGHRGWHMIRSEAIIAVNLPADWLGLNVKPRFLAGIVDGAIMARGQAFAGTHRSTMSALAQLRVQTWQNGCSVLVNPQ
ncbi:uncharacterized protein L969DRAFT_44720 [Mixia osmundae IAM 14324]|uniref:GDP-fucose protein O-fucosyltransferase n=1 Tax=Mixia osmundae (strain CBS 9802 / IAM 14324 / JCM 22182 / KY 12970) TaxID=764103 RepID=G7DU06_MIXOS|nr:uncharacterized protein L969DRAFT_44720 [Mixia osmundae IAM 14324]KEI41779.1 hypothetical protein L969DRAFT_44720 [Mixia osmundae IAM 14324]GAA94066.1 hypothetical protein E5Q_00713 [Mixia osmundae IAM 14324]